MPCKVGGQGSLTLLLKCSHLWGGMHWRGRCCKPCCVDAELPGSRRGCRNVRAASVTSSKQRIVLSGSRDPAGTSQGRPNGFCHQQPETARKTGTNGGEGGDGETEAHSDLVQGHTGSLRWSWELRPDLPSQSPVKASSIHAVQYE